MADKRSTTCGVRRVVTAHLELPPKGWAVSALLVMVLYAAQDAPGQEIINRREQARRMLLATPRSIYGHYCAHCHGDDGTGGGRLWPTELSVKPADLTALGAGEDYLIEAIREGSAVHGKSNLCPPWGRTIAPMDVQRLARYIAALGGESSSEPQAPAPGLSAPSAFGGPPEGLPAPVNEPFPWLLGAVLLAEVVVVGWMLRTKAQSAREAGPTGCAGEAGPTGCAREAGPTGCAGGTQGSAAGRKKMNHWIWLKADS